MEAVNARADFRDRHMRSETLDQHVQLKELMLVAALALGADILTPVVEVS